MIMALVPHAARLPMWISLLVASCLAWRFAVDNYSWRAPPRWLRVVLLMVVVIAILKTFGTFLGREAGVAFLAASVGLKALEIRALRDYLISVFLVFFLLVAQFLYSQSFAVGIYGFAVAAVSILTLARLNRPSGHSSADTWALVARVIVLGLPVCIAMYVFFPRIQGSLWGLPEDAFGSSSGLSDEVSPGSFEALSLNFDLAFRVEFQGEPPAPNERYWRVHVLSQERDGAWRRRDIPFDGPGPGGFEAEDAAVEYVVALEPHGQRWVPALDLPDTQPEGTLPRSGFLVHATRPVNQITRFELASRRALRMEPLNDIQTRINLQTEQQPGPRARRLADQWAALGPGSTAQAFLDYVREQPFRYTLNPLPLEGPAVESFMFDTRSGYCEHYASAFVSMMRWAGVPARMVVGYQGGEWNQAGGYLSVYQSDAHAWAEYWSPGSGWVRVDPTAAVAPERVELGAESIRLLLEQGLTPGALPGLEVRRLISRPWLQSQWIRAQHAWDVVNHSWNKWVMAYGPEAQRKVMNWLGFATPSWTQMAAVLGTSVALMLILIALFVHGRRESRDPIVREYRRALAKLGKLGLDADDAEGPLALQKRLDGDHPEIGRRFRPITEMYIAMRYREAEGLSPAMLRTVVSRFS